MKHIRILNIIFLILCYCSLMAVKCKQIECPISNFGAATFDFNFKSTSDEENAIKLLAECYIMLTEPISDNDVWQQPIYKIDTSLLFALSTSSMYYPSTRLKAIYWINCIYHKTEVKQYSSLINISKKGEVLDLELIITLKDTTKTVLENTLQRNWVYNETEIGTMNEMSLYLNLWLEELNRVGLDSMRIQQKAPMDEDKFKWS